MTLRMGGNDCDALMLYLSLPWAGWRLQRWEFSTFSKGSSSFQILSAHHSISSYIAERGIEKEAKIEAQESRITVLPNVVKSRHFGIPLKMFTSSSSPSPSGASEGNDTTHYKAFGSSVLEMSVWEGNWVGARFGGWLCSKLRGQTGWGGGGEGGHRTGGPLTTASLLRLHTKVILPPQLSPLKSYKGPQITRKLSTFPQYK